MSLPGAVSPSTPERSVSRDSMEDYWSEMKNIEEDRPERQEELAERGSADGAYRRTSSVAFPPSGRTVPVVYPSSAHPSEPRQPTPYNNTLIRQNLTKCPHGGNDIRVGPTVEKRLFILSNPYVSFHEMQKMK